MDLNQEKQAEPSVPKAFVFETRLGRLGLVKKLAVLFLAVVFLLMWYVYNELYVAEAQSIEEINFSVAIGETGAALAARLKEENIIRNGWLFKKYLVFKGLDKKIQAGEFRVLYPITLARVANALPNAMREDEEIITIIPGWDNRALADYFKKQGIIASENEFYDLVGRPAYVYRNGAPELSLAYKILVNRPDQVSYEGYFAPETYRIFKDATLAEIVEKLVAQQNKLFTDKMHEDISRAGRTVHEVLTIASLLEREVRTSAEKAEVADIFWRRLDAGWALQADSTVHYITGEYGDVFTTKAERDLDSPWNTYKYAGLPPGPIAAPGLDSIMAAIYPQENNDWYFLTTLDGEVKYGKDLDGHNRNVQKYLR